MAKAFSWLTSTTNLFLPKMLVQSTLMQHRNASMRSDKSDPGPVSGPGPTVSRRTRQTGRELWFERPCRTFLAAQRSTMLQERGVFSVDITDQQKSPSIAVATLEDVQRDMGALRNDVSRLSKEVSGYLSKTGRKAFRDANEQAGARTHWGKPPLDRPDAGEGRWS